MRKLSGKHFTKIIALSMIGLTIFYLSGSSDLAGIFRPVSSASAASTSSDETTIYGQVTKITGSEVTLALGTLNTPSGQPSGGSGNSSDTQTTPPPAPSGNSSTTTVTPTAAPSSTDTTVTPTTAPSSTDATVTPTTAPSSSSDTTTPPALPDGTAPSPLTLSGEEKTITVTDTTLLSSLKTGDILKVTYTTSDDTETISSVELVNFGPGNQSGSSNGQSGSQPGSQSQNSSGSPSITGTASLTVNNKTVSKTGKTYTASNSNESGIRVTNGGKLTLKKSRIVTTGKTTSEDESNFYGLNAGIVVESKSSANISNTSIKTSGDGANGVFAYGTNAKITIKNSTINTSSNSSRGLDATFGGIIKAYNLKITTQGAHCATIATDRGEGTITASHITGSTAGEGSPCIYSTGNITVTDSSMKATGSEAACIEGKNSITLSNTSLTGYKKHGVMLYQSTSGDAAVGTATFTMTDGSLTSKVGPLFYITNTSAIVNLNHVTIKNSTDSLLAANADSWGTSGSNGGTVVLTAKKQSLSGTVTADSISSVTMSLRSKSTLNSTINSANTAKYIKLSLDSSSKWKVTGDSYITVFADKDTTLANIDDNGHTIYYDSSNSSNSWLNGKTITLTDGGKLTPVTK